jgi:hypothetical protein
MRHTTSSCGPGNAATGLSGIANNPEATQHLLVANHQLASFVDAAY